LRALFFPFFQFKKERLICSSILGLFHFGFIVLFVRVGGPIMYQKVLHSQLFTHNSLSQKKKKTMKNKGSLKQIQFFFLQCGLLLISIVHLLCLCSFICRIWGSSWSNFCVWKNSLCICIFCSIFTSMQVDLASLCVARAKQSSIYSSAWLAYPNPCSWLQKKTQRADCKSNKPQIVEFKSKKTQIADFNPTNPNIWIQNLENPKSLISIQQTQISELKI
jgi:hypothetical protein